MRNARPGGPYRAAPSSLAVSHRAAQHCPDCRVEYVASATTCADCGSDLARGRAPVPPDDRVVPFEDVADTLGPPDRQSLRDWVRGAIIAPAALGDAARYLVEQATALILLFGEEVIGVELPAAVELVITETEPGVQGDRVSGARKPATLETGLVVQVPLFIETGERVKVDTRSGEYLSRA